MKFLVDFLLIAIILGFTVYGIRKGFIKTAVSFLKNIIAFAVAYMFSSKLGAWLKEQVFMDKVRAGIEKKIAELIGSDTAVGTDFKILNEHSGFAKLLENMGVDIEGINQYCVNSDGTVNEKMSEYIAEPCVNALSSVMAFIILFVGTLLVLMLIGFLLNQFAKLPVLHGTNKLLGGVFGLVIGVFWAFVATALIRMVIPYFSDSAPIASLGDGNTLYNFLTTIAPTFLASIL